MKTSEKKSINLEIPAEADRPDYAEYLNKRIIKFLSVFPRTVMIGGKAWEVGQIEDDRVNLRQGQRQSALRASSLAQVGKQETALFCHDYKQGRNQKSDLYMLHEDRLLLIYGCAYYYD
jgi:hypothetical protein